MVGYEVLGVERRRRWSVAQKRRIVAEAFSSAEGVSSIARRHGLYPQQIYRWRRELEDGGIGEPPLHFLPVSVVAAVDGEGAAPARETVCLEIGCVGRLRLPQLVEKQCRRMPIHARQFGCRARRRTSNKMLDQLFLNTWPQATFASKRNHMT